MPATRKTSAHHFIRSLAVVLALLFASSVLLLASAEYTAPKESVRIDDGDNAPDTAMPGSNSSLATLSPSGFSAGTYTLSATSPGLASATSASFTISAPNNVSSPAKLAFLAQPSTR